MIHPAHTFTVTPSLPPQLKALDDLSRNMWWSWDGEAIQLFSRLDLDLWNEIYHGPRRLLGKISQEKLEEAAQDEGYLAQLERVMSRFNEYMDGDKGWFRQAHADRMGAMRVAYFSAEFGIHESVPLYSGGLGCLAGDHLKSASDLGVPLVAVGLAYRQGYFSQYLGHDGYQQETYPENDFYNMPMELQRDERGQPLNVDVHMPGRLVYAQIWNLQVGRIPLYLLDTNIPRNQPDDRQITGQLYGGDKEMRLKQEILLGIGGARALEALNLHPTIVHMNEGHAAFAGVERLRQLMRERGVGFAEAMEIVQSSSVFTTHTPVPAGHDVFGLDMIDKYLSHYARELGLSRDEFFNLGNENPSSHAGEFSMTGLALRMAGRRNGVSALHGEVARGMWTKMWPGVPKSDVPVGHVTNGVHFPSWVSPEMLSLYVRYLGPRCKDEPWNTEVWSRVEAIPDAELWRTHERRRERLVAFARNRLRQSAQRRQASGNELRMAQEVLDPDALTLGFARRFATYKRATLLFKDMERLQRLLNDKDRPVQIIFAGKAHPQDSAGKTFIKEIISMAKRPEFRRRIVFIADYDINVGRYMTQGVDVWLNNPRRPHEASGTSGMKVVMNGGLHCSILDGWWDEAFTAERGFAIGSGEEYQDVEQEDLVESLALYEILEKEVVPRFYDRGVDGVPHRWLAMMKASIQNLTPRFNTDRMVQDYCTKFYLPSQTDFDRLEENNMARASRLAQYRRKVRDNWQAIHVERVVTEKVDGGGRVGGTIPVKADIRLGALKPDEVSVDLYHGRLDADGTLKEGEASPMTPEGGGFTEHGLYRFVGQVPCEHTGLNGFAVRVLPKHEDLASPYEPFLIKWA